MEKVSIASQTFPKSGRPCRSRLPFRWRFFTADETISFYTVPASATDHIIMTAFLWTRPDTDPAATLLLAHGAGAPMDSTFMEKLAVALAAGTAMPLAARPRPSGPPLSFAARLACAADTRLPSSSRRSSLIAVTPLPNPDVQSESGRSDNN